VNLAFGFVYIRDHACAKICLGLASVLISFL